MKTIVGAFGRTFLTLQPRAMGEYILIDEVEVLLLSIDLVFGEQFIHLDGVPLALGFDTSHLTEFGVKRVVRGGYEPGAGSAPITGSDSGQYSEPGDGFVALHILPQLPVEHPLLIHLEEDNILPPVLGRHYQVGEKRDWDENGTKDKYYFGDSPNGFPIRASYSSNQNDDAPRDEEGQSKHLEDGDKKGRGFHHVHFIDPSVLAVATIMDVLTLVWLISRICSDLGVVSTALRVVSPARLIRWRHLRTIVGIRLIVHAENEDLSFDTVISF